MLLSLWARWFAPLFVYLRPLYFYLRPMIKWFIRKVTGKCELLRITLQYPLGAERTLYIEDSLRQSSHAEMKRLAKETETNIEAAVLLVMKAKLIIPEVHTHFHGIFRQCLVQINGYLRLQSEVESIRQIKYSSDNPEHEKKLMQLWVVLTNGQHLESRTSSQWTQIGFQGEDPMTDFRGMGMLGLDQLVYFTTKYTSVARALLSKSHNPKNGYSFAIVGINMTELVYTFLVKGNLKTHFYNYKQSRPTLEEFHEIYCYVFYEFDKFWFSENPKDIMDFGRIREKFRKRLKHRLREPRAVLEVEFH